MPIYTPIFLITSLPIKLLQTFYFYFKKRINKKMLSY